MKPRPEIFWPAFVVALFAGAVLANMVLVFRATGDPSHAVLPDYYQRALRWDEKLAQDRKSAALGWQLRIEAARPLRVTLADRLGRPIDRATLRVSLFHKARSARVLTREHLTDYLERKTEEEYSSEEAAEDVRVLAAFDFVDKDFDIAGLLVDLHSSQVVGLYSNEDDTLYLISEPGKIDPPVIAKRSLDYVSVAHASQVGHCHLPVFRVQRTSHDHAFSLLLNAQSH